MFDPIFKKIEELEGEIFHVGLGNYIFGILTIPLLPSDKNTLFRKSDATFDPYMKTFKYP